MVYYKPGKVNGKTVKSLTFWVGSEIGGLFLLSIVKYVLHCLPFMLRFLIVPFVPLTTIHFLYCRRVFMLHDILPFEETSTIL
jgi:hypothetical protein